MTYIHEVFLPQTLEAAKHVALTSDPQDPQKFARETHFLVDFLLAQRLVSADTHVLDFGCGMGRVARALIEQTGCRVEGTDTSPAMRHFAQEYVSSPKFCVSQAPTVVADLALACFVLQHVEYPEHEVENIYQHLTPNGTLVLVNEPRRFVPSGVDRDGYVVWNDDRLNIEQILGEYFVCGSRHAYCSRPEPILSVWSRKESPKV